MEKQTSHPRLKKKAEGVGSTLLALGLGGIIATPGSLETHQDHEIRTQIINDCRGHVTCALGQIRDISADGIKSEATGFKLTIGKEIFEVRKSCKGTILVGSDGRQILAGNLENFIADVDAIRGGAQK